jgi:hypothetical protein
MDGRVASIEVVRRMDGAKPQPPQTFNPADSLGWVRAEWVMQQLSNGRVGDGPGELTHGRRRKAESGRQNGGTARVEWRVAITHRPNTLEVGGFPGRLP